MNELSKRDDFEKNQKWQENLDHLSSLTQKHLLQSVPVGSIIVDVLNFKSEVKTKRTISFVEDLFKKFQTEFGTDFNYEKLKNESFADLFELVLSKIENTKSEFKKDRFRDILLLKVKFDSDHLLFMKFVELLDKVNEIQIILLKELIQDKKNALGILTQEGNKLISNHLEYLNNNSNSIDDSIEDYATNNRNDEIELYLLELVSLGLIKTISPKTQLGGTNTPRYIPTDISRKFISFIIND